MREWLTVATQYSILVIDAMALVLILLGTIEAFFGGILVMFSSAGGHAERDVWLRYARWLVAGLTFQLAADVIETSIAPSWEDIARVAAIARHPHLSQLLPRARPGRGPQPGARIEAGTRWWCRGVDAGS